MNHRDYGAGTHVGRVRRQNEDCFYADAKAGIWLVADGMGGRQAGEVASAIVADFIPSALKQGAPLTEAVARSHQAVIDLVREGKGVTGMGSTAVVLKINGNNYEIAWVGDSRAYLWNGSLRLLTHDHTFVQRLLDAGAINAQEAKKHPQRNSLIQALGSTEIDGIEVDVLSGKLSPGEQILLCSDGLTRDLSEDQIAAILKKDLGVQERVDSLIQAALDVGGRDNITVLLIPYQSGITQTVPLKVVDYRGTSPSSVQARWTRVGLLLITAVIVMLCAWWLLPSP